MENELNLIISEADLERMQAEVDEAMRLGKEERNEEEVEDTKSA